MSQIPQCRHCLTEYESYSEQQAGFSYDTLIKVWICPACGHRKSVYTQEDIAAWGKAKKHNPPEVRNRDFESIYKNPNTRRGGHGAILTDTTHRCGDNCKCGDSGCGGSGKGGCGGGCGGCGH